MLKYSILFSDNMPTLYRKSYTLWFFIKQIQHPFLNSGISHSVCIWSSIIIVFFQWGPTVLALINLSDDGLWCPQVPCCYLPLPSTYMLQSCSQAWRHQHIPSLHYDLGIFHPCFPDVLNDCFLSWCLTVGLVCGAILMSIKPWAEILDCNEFHRGCAIQSTNKRIFLRPWKTQNTDMTKRPTALHCTLLTGMNLAWRMSPC